MRKLFMLIATLAMTTMFAQADTMGKTEAVASQGSHDTSVAALTAQTDETTVPQDDKNASEKGTQEEK